MIIYTQMWMSIIGSLVATNLLLLAIYLTGAAGIMFTWIPGRTIIVCLSLLSLPKEQLVLPLLTNIASHIIPVVFLVVFRIGIFTSKGRQPRFASHPMWSIVWLVALFVMVGAFVSLWSLKNELTLGVIGIGSAFLNFANIQDMHHHLKSNAIKITWLYVLIANVVVAGVVFGISELVNNDQQLIASIVSNIPFVSVCLLAQSTLTSIGTEITSQHVYMLAYQLWPSLAFISTCLLTRDRTIVVCLLFASLATAVVIGIQFMIIMKKVL